MARFVSKVAILGGTFDPPHNGHSAVARAALDALGIDRMVFMPTGQPNFKQGQHVSAAADRVAMTQLLCETDERFEVSCLEVDRPGVTYTADTLELLHENDPGAELVLVVGADCIEHIMRWKRAEVIARLATVVAIARPGFDFAKARQAHAQSDLNFRVEYISAETPDISSTQVRQAAAAGEPLDGLVPQSIARYIAKRHLYTEQEN